MISLISSLYNTEEYLHQCLDSVINQTFKDIEVILIDDGSTDSSGIICDSYCEAYSNFSCYHISKAGPAYGRQFGLSKAKGEYICFIDSDDWLEPDYCRLMYESMTGNHADMCVSDFYTNDTVTNHWEAVVMTDKKQIYDTYFTNGIYNRLWNKMYRYESIKDIQFPVGRDMMEDAYWMPQALSRATCITRLSEPLYHYRVRGGSLMNQKRSVSEKKKMLLNGLFKVSFFFKDAADIDSKWLIELLEKDIKEIVNYGYLMDQEIYLEFIRFYDENRQMITSFSSASRFTEAVCCAAGSAHNPGGFYSSYIRQAPDTVVDKKRLILHIIQKKLSLHND